jgi:phage terminase large subunit
LAVAALWWLARYKDGVVLTTSSTFRQVRTQVWSEIHRLAAGAKVPYPEINSTELKFRGDDNYALGLSTNRAENFQGYHGKHVLIIADEAPGIEATIWEAMAGIMAGGHVHVVLAGNPTIPSGIFFDAFHRARSSWNCITIDVFDSPNLKGLTLEELLNLDPREGGPLDQNPFPYLATKRWVYDQWQQWWHGDERSSPIWMSRVRGQFPDQAENALIKLPWLERAKERAMREPVSDRGGRLSAGVDVGGGSAETAAYVLEFKTGRYRILAIGAWRAQDTRGQVVQFLAPYRNRLSTVRVDAVSIGYNFGLHLRDQGFPVELVNVGLPCETRLDLGETDPAKRFANKKAQLYQNLADALDRDLIDGLFDEETIAQLADLRYEIDPRGRMRIESKQKALKRHISSPDRAEALMLAIGERYKGDLWMQQALAIDDHRNGRSIESIADHFETTVEEVESWIKGRAQREVASSRSRFERECAAGDGIIGINDQRTVFDGRVFHAKCGRRAAIGPWAV